MVIDKDSEPGPPSLIAVCLGVILMMVFLFAFFFVGGWFVSPFSFEDSNNETNQTNATIQPTFYQIYVYCNSALDNYTNSNRDYLLCETKDECDYKTLQLSVFREKSFNCMNAFWGERT